MSDETSYSLRAKEQLCLSLPGHRDCLLAEIAAAAQLCGSLIDKTDPDGRPARALELVAETPALAKRLYELIKRYTGSGGEISMISKARLYRRKTYSVTLQHGHTQLLQQAGVLAGEGIAREVPGWLADLAAQQGDATEEGLCCIRSYLRAVFLFCGSAVQPQKAYHIELVLRDEGFARGVIGLLNRLEIDGRITRRKEASVVYIKEADAVSDFWANIGAFDAMLEHEDTRIMKQVRNDVNRAVNCETANLSKTVNAALHQRECIAYLDERGLLAKLPEQLRAAAQARLKYPEASISELADAMQPPISKSGMNHRLRRICQLAAGEGYDGV